MISQRIPNLGILSYFYELPGCYVTNSKPTSNYDGTNELEVKLKIANIASNE